MAEAQHIAVPSNFSAPPAPAGETQTQTFQVPPAGPPAALPQHTIQLPGQIPGYVNQNREQQAPAQQPAAQPATPDVSTLVTLLTNALNPQGQAAAAPEQAAQPGEGSVRPDWLKTSANEFDVATIQDPTIRSMAEILQTTGKDLDLDRVLGNALAHGDASLIDLNYINEKGGANAASLAQLARGIVQAISAKSEAVTQSVFALVGGEANWNQASVVFNKSAPAEVKALVAQMLDSTDDKYITAGAKIVAEFARTSGALPQVGSPLLGSLGAAGIVGQGLTKVQFQEELRKIKPDTATASEERKALYARRSLGKRVGI